MSDRIDDFIPVACPNLTQAEKSNVMKCLEDGWISSGGEFIGKFEEGFARFIGTKHAIAVCNGTLALHLALVVAGIGPGDEVIVPDVTYIATANAVAYCGATVVFADVEKDTLNIDVNSIERLITSKTKAIIPVHLFGIPCDIAAVLELADRHGLLVIEDTAEALGSRVDGRLAGAWGKAGMFSFFGNKTLTTGEGGMVVTDDDDFAEKCRLFRGQGMSSSRRYWHPVIGYNYRMTNVAAAIGLGQLTTIEERILRRQNVLAWYREFGERDGLFDHLILPSARRNDFNSVWMVNMILKEGGEERRDWLMTALRERGIETRPTFYPLHTMPPYQHCKTDTLVNSNTALSGITLPTFETLSRAQVERIVLATSDLLAAA